MIDLFCFLLALLMAPFKPMWWLEAENAALRQQLTVLRRKSKSRPSLTNSDRVAEYVRRALDRLDPSRVHRSLHHIQ